MSPSSPPAPRSRPYRCSSGDTAPPPATSGLIGSATSAVLTPSARLLRRNSTEATRPAVFASQFSLSHLCFLVTYPVAGTLGAALGLGAVALVLTVLGAVGAVVAAATWLRGEKPGVDDDDTVAPATLVG